MLLPCSFDIFNIHDYIALSTHGYLSLTNKDREEEHGDGDVEDGRGYIQEPVGCHGEKAQEEQEEEQTSPVFLYLRCSYTEKLKREKEKEREKHDNLAFIFSWKRPIQTSCKCSKAFETLSVQQKRMLICRAKAILW